MCHLDPLVTNAAKNSGEELRGKASNKLAT